MDHGETAALLGVKETARTLGVSVDTVRRLIDAGELKAVHIGARLLISRSEIDRAITHGLGIRRLLKAQSGDAR